jgi:Transposase DDE domain
LATSLVGNLVGYSRSTEFHSKDVAVDQSTLPSTRDPIHSVRDRLGQQDGLPFLDLLSRSSVEAACRRCRHRWRGRIYTPWITPSLFLSQILSDDHPCDEAVEELRKSRHDRGLASVSPETGSYCDARQRLPEDLIRDLARRAGQSIHDHSKGSWSFHDRPVKIVDGSTVVMPDTREDRAASPQAKAQAPGPGFPIARILVAFSLAVGTVLDAAVGPSLGKQTSEPALLRQITGHFQPGDIVLADRFYGSYWPIAALQARGVDVLVRLHQGRAADFRRGRRSGREGHIVTWPRPQEVPTWMSRAELDAMPRERIIRELRVRVRDRTKRVREMVIATTLPDCKIYPADELRGSFRERWHAELDLRTLRTMMQMEMLRAGTPEMVREEIGMYFLAYNLIRGTMAEAARAGKIEPRSLSSKGALHTARAFEEVHLYEASRIGADLPRLVESIGRKRVGGRPDRYEPRAVKRRPRPHPRLRMTRREAQRLIRSGMTPHSKG